MQSLFNATLQDGTQKNEYEVIFKDDFYDFKPSEEGKEGFRFQRKHEEWHSEGNIDTATKSQAIEALENYLLSQH